MKTSIEWCDHSINPIRARHKATWGVNGTRVKTSDANWRLPLKWNREAEKAGVRRKVFCSSLADVFEDWTGPIHDHRGGVILQCDSCLHPDDRPHRDSVPPFNPLEKYYEHGCGEHFRQLKMSDLRRDLFALIDKTPWLDWQLLTKRPENIRRMLVPHCLERVPGHVSQNEGDGTRIRRRENIWLGTSVSNQETADKMIPELLKCRDLSPVLFLSMEPLLGPVDLMAIGSNSQTQYPFIDCLRSKESPGPYLRGAGIDWVIVGGESGHHARPMHPQWAREIRDQCQAAGVPFFFKQWGSREPFAEFGGIVAHSGKGKSLESLTVDGQTTVFSRVGKEAAGDLLDGVQWHQFPQLETTHA